MKFSFVSRRRRMAFTLVELLVVIGIIAILAAVTVASVGAAIRFAKRTKANTTASQISTAVQNYYTEYGVYPVATGTTGDAYYDGASGEGAWQPLMYALCGNQNPYSPTGTAGASSATVPNTRAIAYLSPTHSDIDQNGILLNPFDTVSAGNATAPGINGATYFYMEIDGAYSGVVGGNGGPIPPDFTSSTNVTNPGTHPVPGGVCVWSPCDQALNNSKSSQWAHTY